MPSRRPWLAPTLMLALLGSQTQGCGLEAVPAALLPVAAAGGLAVGGLGAWLLKPGDRPNPIGSTPPGAIQGNGSLVHDGGVVFAQGQAVKIGTKEGEFTTDELGEVASLGVAARQIALMLSNTQQDRVPLAPPVGATAEAQQGSTYALAGLTLAPHPPSYRLSQNPISPPPPNSGSLCEDRFKNFDLDRDARLSKEEFVSFAMKQKGLGQSEALDVFAAWNANLDPYIDPAEFCRNLESPAPKAEAWDPICMSTWLMHDGDGDGFLNMAEFQAGKKATAPSQPTEELLRAEFKKLDRDQNALLGPMELCGSPLPGGEGPAPLPMVGSPAEDPACMAAFNTDAKPQISFAEYSTAMTGGQELSPAVYDAVKASFLRLDANNSGDLDAFELCGRGPLAPGAAPPPPRPSAAVPPPVVAQGSGGLQADGSLAGRFSFEEAGDISYQASAPIERQDSRGVTVVERNYEVNLFGVANSVVVSRPKAKGAVAELGIRWKPSPQLEEVDIQVRANSAEIRFPGGGKGSLSALALSGGALQSQGSLTSPNGRVRDVAVGLLADGRTSCTLSEPRFALQMLFDPAGRASGSIMDARGNTLGQMNLASDGSLTVQLSNGAKGKLQVQAPR